MQCNETPIRNHQGGNFLARRPEINFVIETDWHKTPNGTRMADTCAGMLNQSCYSTLALEIEPSDSLCLAAMHFEKVRSLNMRNAVPMGSLA